MRQVTRERQNHVLSEVLVKKHVTVRDLASNLGVSEATVRRDLRTLAEKQKLQLTHGGATLPINGDFAFESKLKRNHDAKVVIGELAAQLVADNDQIFLDSGTTCLEMATRLSGRRGLSVIINSVRLATEMTPPRSAGNHNLISLGGLYRPDRMDFVGPIAVSTLEQLRGYTAFIGADGLALDFGISASDIESAHLHRIAVHNARETVLLVDHSKFQSSSLYKIVDWNRITKLVTDQPPFEEWMRLLDDHKIELVTPSATSLEPQINTDEHR
jgi:DeoR/GlpR family transcriptional regulator of sugar metabolism